MNKPIDGLNPNVFDRLRRGETHVEHYGVRERELQWRSRRRKREIPNVFRVALKHQDKSIKINDNIVPEMGFSHLCKLLSAKVCQFCCKLYQNLSNPAKLCRNIFHFISYFISAEFFTGKKCKF